MLIGIDTFGADHGRSGIGLYLLSLLSKLPKLDSISYELFGSEIDRYNFTTSNNFSFTGISIPDSVLSEFIWHLTRASSFSVKRGYDVTLYSAGGRFLPTKFKVPGVAVVNDVISELPSFNQGSFFAKKIKKGFMNCTKIIVASQFIKKELVSMSINPEKIEVIHNGIDHSLFYPRTELTGDVVEIKPFAIKRPYFIYAAKLQGPAKKHVELIRAFSVFKKKTGLPHRLILAGGAGPYFDTVHKEVIDSPYASDIFLTGFFPHENLSELYSCADACIVPSVGEGVGMPVLEAMASGVPVACAKAGALPEIAGSNALFFSPDDIGSMADAMETIILDKTLREKLHADGIAWAKRFSWEKTASKTLEVLCQAAKTRK